ncbi:MAG: hypothetical protein NT118_11595 [Lentisphaerae bacterium]|nr:hypothetical protein [Lentisphaerota bacterium]
MKQNLGKTLKIFLAVAGAVVIAILAIAVFKYYQVRNSHQTIAAPVFSLVPTKDIKLGDTVLASANLKCPWNRRPVNASVTPGKGSQTVDSTGIRINRLGWGYWIWNISVGIQPYANGKIEDGKINIELNPPLPGDEQKEITASIPSFEAGAIDTGKSPELAIAGSISKKTLSSKFLIISLIVFLIVISIVLFFWFRKKKNISQPTIPPWDIALVEFSRLRVQLKENRVTPVICVFRLSDIIRTYLEKRFSLHAPTQTSTEFLEDLKREKSPLKPDDKDFLEEFMTASDLVKFAKLPADAAIIENAINKAETLVKTTKPAEVDGR